jgi:hypothetical protein
MATLLVEGSGVHDGLRVAFAAKDDHQIRHHCRPTLIVQFDNVLL